jgi:hypothetical protein
MTYKIPKELQKFPPHLKNFILNAHQVSELIAIRKFLHKPVKGPVPQEIAVLDKSALVLLVACWERYLEELADAAFVTMLNQCSAHTVIPTVVRDIVAKSLKASDNHSELWKLAGNGWRAVLQSHKTAVYKRTLDKFHNPQSKEIDLLFYETLGYKNLTREWHWQGMTADAARKRLGLLVERRHHIAHKVETSHRLGLKYLTQELDFLSGIAAISSNRIGVHVGCIVGGRVLLDDNEWFTNVSYNSHS